MPSSETKTASADRAARRIKAHLLINAMCKGDKWRMSIPPRADDSDMLLEEVIRDSRELECEVDELRASLAASQRDTERLREENAQLRQFIKDTPAAVLGP